MGASGGDQSTLSIIPGGLDRPSVGSVRFEDRELTRLDDAALTRYRREHVGFADVSATLERAPDPLPERPATIDGEQRVEKGSVREVVLAAAFAEPQGLRPGDRIGASINGERRRLAVVGSAHSAAHVYALPPSGLMPADRRFGVACVDEPPSAAAFDMARAFDDASLTLAPQASGQAVIAAVDRRPAPCGGIGAIGRDDRLSNPILPSEIRRLRTIATVMPSVPLAVAARLTHMATSRVIALECREIGLFKTSGDPDFAVARPDSRSALATVVGVAGGSWLGRTISISDADVVRSPFRAYRLDPKTAVAAAGVAFAVASLDAVAAVRRAVRLPPAVAMRPQPVPAVVRPGGGVLLVDSPHGLDSIEALIVSHFERTTDFDPRVSFGVLNSDAAIEATRALPGVVRGEPTRTIAAELRAGSCNHRGSVEGLAPDAEPMVVRDVARGAFRPSPGGLMSGDELAVEIGRRNDERAEARAGLAAGAVVVRFPSERVADAPRVRARRR